MWATVTRSLEILVAFFEYYGVRYVDDEFIKTREDIFISFVKKKKRNFSLSSLEHAAIICSHIINVHIMSYQLPHFCIKLALFARESCNLHANSSPMKILLYVPRQLSISLSLYVQLIYYNFLRRPLCILTELLMVLYE